MSILVLHLRICGFALILLGLAHGLFGRFLDWRTDLSKLTVLNRQIFLVHTFYIGYFVTALGILDVCFAQTLMRPEPLSRFLLSVMTLTWAVRLVIQLFVWDRAIWRGSPFRRNVHYGLILFWSYVTVVHVVALVRSGLSK